VFEYLKKGVFPMMANTNQEARKLIDELRSIAENITEEDVSVFAAWQKEHGRWNPTPSCPPLPRFHTAIIRGDDWTESELAHVRACDYCRRTEQKVRQLVWHPTVAQLFMWRLHGLRGSDAEDVTYHLETDGCRRCNLLVEFWITGLVNLVQEGKRRMEEMAAGLAGVVAGWQRLQPAYGFDNTTRPPFQFTTALEDGSLSVTVRETDEGQLWVHVLSPQGERAGQVIRVELLGASGPVGSRNVQLKPRPDGGCSGRASFGRFAEVANCLEGECAVVATVVPEGTAEPEGVPQPPAGHFARSEASWCGSA
jgi:hypothetical protein